MNDEMAPWVLIEGPAPGSAEFLGRWLLAAADADRELHDQYARNPLLKQQISRLEVLYVVSFSPPATKFIELLMKNLTCFPLGLWDEWGEMFTVMAELGFFSPTGNRYQMTIPKDISGLKIETTLLRLASTEDDEYYLHPEYIVNFLPKREAEAWSHRLECMPWMQRVADRELLLGGDDSTLPESA
jgi:hypothetical protein